MYKDVKNIATVMWGKPYRYWLLPAWISMLWLFTYLLSINLFSYVFSNPKLSSSDKLSFLIQSFTNTFSNFNDPRALSLGIFSFLATVNIVLMIRLFRERRSQHDLTKTGGATVVTLIGSHCVACGGS